MRVATRLRKYVRRRWPRIFGVLDYFAIHLNERRRGRSGTSLVTVVVPLYNQQRFVLETLASIRSQSYRNFEVIVINDASTDNGPREVAQFTTRDKRFRLVHHEGNRGLAATRNTGLQLAKGRYILFLDSDDCLLQHTLWRRVRELDDRPPDPDIAGSYCHIQVTPESGRVKYLRLGPLRFKPAPDKDFISCQGECPFNAHAPLLYTDVVRRFGGFREELRFGCEDWDLWYRMMRHGYRFVGNGHIGAIYRQKAGSMVRSLAASHFEQARTLIAMAHSPMPEKDLVSGTPFVYWKPLSLYQQAITMARRAIPFATIACIEGDRDGARRIIASLPRHGRFYLARHLNLPGLIRNGSRRAARHYGPEPFKPSPAVRDAEKLMSQMIIKQIDGPLIGLDGDPVSQLVLDTPDVLFMPHNAYHTSEMAPVARELQRRGYSYLFVDIAKFYREEGARNRMIELGLPYVDYSHNILVMTNPKVLFVMNDWGSVVRDKVMEAKVRGIRTIGLVEGVQDYEDTHVKHNGVGRIRAPYQRVDVPLLVGDYDRSFFNTGAAVVTGSTRIEALAGRQRSNTPRKRLVAINSNFTYGVYTNIQSSWIEGAVDACRVAGVQYVISQHPADEMGLSGYNRTDKPLYDVLEECTVLVSRFSGAMLEAMALGTPTIYHIPHGERADTFQNPMGAYPITTTVLELADAISSFLGETASYRERSQEFFEYHVSLDSQRTCPERIAHVIEQSLVAAARE